MRYNHYTSKSPKISEIGFGAWQLGNPIAWSSMTDHDAINLVHEALDMGVNFFDTAPNYGKGASERLLGEALKNINRSKIAINTKFGHTHAGETNYSADYIRESLEGSLKRLKTDYVDSILIHSPEKRYIDGSHNEHYEVLEQLKKEGKILAYGASLENSAEMISYMTHTEGQVIEAFFNILHQDARHAFEMAREKGVVVIAKIPLDSGWLSGKYTADSTFDGVRSRWSQADITTRARVVDQIKDIPIEGQSLSQVAIAYCLSYEAVATVIPGNKNLEQLDLNVRSADYPMSEKTVSRLEQFYDHQIKGMHLPW
jgi:aryl-alcohol dehydrogenase-like predicted oxidoreductase